ncbi:hypothetical protein RN001_014942 [Aquatica leii]|uniref:FAD synthase n=1 Tax=Aquatica leii TaxID=1421715 RepID=A0AAN7QC69_9COLE|nr:hypothetical protein RN001_014942 [Aquatica leii]
MENEDKTSTDIDFIRENLQSINYNVSGTTIGYYEDLLIKELEHSVKYTDAVILFSDVGAPNSDILWQAISKVFHQTIVSNRRLKKLYGVKNAYETMYSKCLEHPGVPPVIYLQGVFVIDYKEFKSAFLNIVVPVLKNLNAKLLLTQLLIIDEVQNGKTLELLPHSDKVHVAYDGGCTLHLSSTSMSALLEYESSVTKMFRNIQRDVGSDISELVYNQRDLHIRHSVKCIEDCFKEYSPENVFVSFNGGKDCTVLLHLILGVLRRNYPNFSGKLFCLYIENSNPFEELNKFIEECRQYYNLDILKLNESIKDSLAFVLEDKPHMKGVFMGTRRTDPFSDHLKSFTMTDSNWPQIMRVSPLLDWHYSQIWDYLLLMKVPYCSLYDAGYTSLGNSTNTIPNPYLLVDNEQKKYLPAYKLLDGSKERSGRKT